MVTRAEQWTGHVPHSLCGHTGRCAPELDSGYAALPGVLGGCCGCVERCRHCDDAQTRMQKKKKKASDCRVYRLHVVGRTAGRSGSNPNVALSTFSKCASGRGPRRAMERSIASYPQRTEAAIHSESMDGTLYATSRSSTNTFAESCPGGIVSQGRVGE